MSGQRKLVFLSFADTRLSQSMKRLEKQILALKIFDRVLLCDEFDLDRKFVNDNKSLFFRHTRGFGYFSWKPYLIQRTLLTLDDGDVLVYSDVGNHFEEAKRDRLHEYIAIAENSPAQIIAPRLSSNYPERCWTKHELLDYFGVVDKEEILSSPQYEANFIVIINSSRAREIIQKWNEVFRINPKLFDESQWLPQLQGFVEHRWDQSAFSILGKLFGMAEIPADRDDLVLRLRDKVSRRRWLSFLLFLVRNRLLVYRLRHQRVLAGLSGLA